MATISACAVGSPSASRRVVAAAQHGPEASHDDAPTGTSPVPAAASLGNGQPHQRSSRPSPGSHRAASVGAHGAAPPSPATRHRMASSTSSNRAASASAASASPVGSSPSVAQSPAARPPEYPRSASTSRSPAGPSASSPCSRPRRRPRRRSRSASPYGESRGTRQHRIRKRAGPPRRPPVRARTTRPRARAAAGPARRRSPPPRADRPRSSRSSAVLDVDIARGSQRVGRRGQGLRRSTAPHATSPQRNAVSTTRSNCSPKPSRLAISTKHLVGIELEVTADRTRAPWPVRPRSTSNVEISRGPNPVQVLAIGHG